jgi:hypothetical protein
MLVDDLLDLFAPRTLQRALGFAAAMPDAVLRRAVLLLAPLDRFAHFPEIDYVAHAFSVFRDG